MKNLLLLMVALAILVPTENDIGMSPEEVEESGTHSSVRGLGDTIQLDVGEIRSSVEADGYFALNLGPHGVLGVEVVQVEPFGPAAYTISELDAHGNEVVVGYLDIDFYEIVPSDDVLGGTLSLDEYGATLSLIADSFEVRTSPVGATPAANGIAEQHWRIITPNEASNSESALLDDLLNDHPEAPPYDPISLGLRLGHEALEIDPTKIAELPTGCCNAPGLPGYFGPCNTCTYYAPMKGYADADFRNEHSNYAYRMMNAVNAMDSYFAEADINYEYHGVINVPNQGTSDNCHQMKVTFYNNYENSRIYYKSLILFTGSNLDNSAGDNLYGCAYSIGVHMGVVEAVDYWWDLYDPDETHNLALVTEHEALHGFGAYHDMSSQKVNGKYNVMRSPQDPDTRHFWLTSGTENYVENHAGSSAWNQS